jgi:hypothetical protein
MDDEITRASLARKGSPYLNSAQACHYLSLSLRTLERLRKDGNGPLFRQIGSSIRYHVDDLKTWSDATSSAKTTTEGRL